jgi:hypothetical protein
MAPPDFATELILDYLNYYDSMLYISRNSSLILPRFSKLKLDFDVRRAFTAHQLLQILEEVHQSILFIEHDGSEDRLSDGFIETLFLGIRDVARRGTVVVVYSYRMDKFMDFVARNADRFIIVKEVNGGFIVWDSGIESFVHNRSYELYEKNHAKR